LGLGHYKNKAKQADYDYGSQDKAHGLALGHSKDKGGGHEAGYGLDNRQGNGGGNGGGRGRGKNK